STDDGQKGDCNSSFEANTTTAGRFRGSQLHPDQTESTLGRGEEASRSCCSGIFESLVDF
ncbi:jg4625, partial [Pararge aegeria aegeria]